MNLTNALEKIGKQSTLKCSAVTNSKELLLEMCIPEAICDALIANDKNTLAALSGISKDIICFIMAPHKEETPKDGNKPGDEDVPLQNNSPLPKVG